MYVDTSPSEGPSLAPVLPRMDGLADVAFAQREGKTRLADLDQRSPLRVLFPRVETGEPPLAAVTTVSGGLVGGDRLKTAVKVGDEAKAVAVGQAAEKVYRSTGPDSIVETGLTVGKEAWLEWLPQETILFDGARLSRKTVANVGPGGRLLAGECLVFGRLARGEIMRSGLVRDRWEVRQDGRLVWADALLVEDNILATLDALSGFGGARAYATAVYVGPDVASYLDTAKELVAACHNVRSGATCVGGVLVARWLSEDPLALRRGFETYWMTMRELAGGLPARLPRLWYI